MKKNIWTYLRKRLFDDYILRIKNHDYEYHYSRSKKRKVNGKRSFRCIERALHELVVYQNFNQKRLLKISLREVKEQYADDLTHRTIRGWFSDYKNNKPNGSK